jgi:hypothetical protein
VKLLRGKAVRAVSVGAAVLALFALSTAMATAVTFHKYSVAYETSAHGAYTGVKVTRADGAFTMSSGSSCTTPYTNPVAYQTQWVIMTSDYKNWVELGTGNQCNNYRYWYWGYGYNGAWYSQGTQGNVGTSSHTFQIYRHNGNAWEYYIDSTQKLTLFWSIIGYHDEAGLESYDANAKAPKHTYRSLSRTTNQGSWVLWAGFDSWTINGPEMCGGWDTASQWRAGEHTTC